MNIGDRVRVINEYSSLLGYEGTIKGFNFMGGLSVLIDGRTFTMHFDGMEVEVIDEV